MAPRTRSLRRAFVDRAKAATRLIGRLALHRDDQMSEADYEAELAGWTTRTFQHRKPCSCQMCRNPRRSSYSSKKARLTLAERRTELTLAEGRAEIAA